MSEELWIIAMLIGLVNHTDIPFQDIPSILGMAW